MTQLWVKIQSEAQSNIKRNVEWPLEIVKAESYQQHCYEDVQKKFMQLMTNWTTPDMYLNKNLPFAMLINLFFRS